MQTIERRKVVVMVIDQVGPFLRQFSFWDEGIPCPQFLFSIAIDTLHLLMEKAHEQGLILILAQHLIPNGVNML